MARRGDQERSQIWLLPADGGEARPLTALSTGVAGPTSEVLRRCSLDGSLISLAFKLILPNR